MPRGTLPSKQDQYPGPATGARCNAINDSTINMKPQPEASTQEVLAGLVERVTYHNAENGFCVLRATAK
jgi:exodeoxyribonuclease V alpha subunit